jgi:hypothetical protein
MDGGSIKEKLLESDDTSYSYKFLREPAAGQKLKGQVLGRKTKGTRSAPTTIHWDANLRRQWHERRRRLEEDQRYFLRRPEKHQAEDPAARGNSRR